VALKSLLFDPDSQPPEVIKLSIRRASVTDDYTDMMPSYHNLIKSVTESNNLPLNVSRPKGDQGRQLEALTEGEDSVDRQDEVAHRVKACLTKKAVEEAIMFDEAHKGDKSKLYYEADNDDVSSKSATEMTVMMKNTATLRPAYSLNVTINAEDEIEVPPDQYDAHDQAKMLEDMKEKKIAPLDALFPKIRVPSDDENMHKSTQEDEKNPAVKAAKTTLYAKSKLAINTLKTYQEDGSRAKTVMTMALHHPS
jgi:hypothetical protein